MPIIAQVSKDKITLLMAGHGWSVHTFSETYMTPHFDCLLNDRHFGAEYAPIVYWQLVTVDCGAVIRFYPALCNLHFLTMSIVLSWPIK